MRVVLSAATVTELRALLNSEVETCAVCLLRRSAADTWIEHKRIIVPDEAYSIRTHTRAELKSSFIFEVIEAAKRLDAGVMFIHTHPDSDSGPTFSSIDDDGERLLRDYLDTKLPGRSHCSLILSSQGTITGVVFEHSPARRDPRFTHDGTAFDAGLRYTTDAGRRGFIAIEVEILGKLHGASTEPSASLR